MRTRSDHLIDQGHSVKSQCQRFPTHVLVSNSRRRRSMHIARSRQFYRARIIVVDPTSCSSQPLMFRIPAAIH